MRSTPLSRPARWPAIAESRDSRNSLQNAGDAAEAYRLKAADLVNEYQMSCSRAALDRLLQLVENEGAGTPEEAEALVQTTLRQDRTLERELARFLAVTDPQDIPES